MMLRTQRRWAATTTQWARRGLATQQQQPPEEADVVVVGGGSLGGAILYHLQQRGLNGVLIERDKLVSGSTWHSAAMLWRLRPSDVDIQLHAYTREMCLELENDDPGSIWRENGGLFIATNAERMAEYERLAETGKYFGIESHVLTPQEILDVHPLLNVSDVYGGLYSPTDGTIDPTAIVHSLAKAAKARGGVVLEDTSVASIETESRNDVKVVKSVTTSDGHRIKTPVVVNACGAWAKSLGAMVGVDLPVLAMKHAYVVTESIPGMHGNLPNVRDHDLSIYLKAQGDAMAIGGYENNPEFWHDVDPNFAFGLFELDWDTFGENLMGHMQRCPSIETAGIKSTVCGPEAFTPDGKALVGPQPGVRGFFNACGFNSMGMMQGGGIGREVATWIAEDSASLDLFAFDCSRFHPDTTANAQWVKDRTHETFAKTYAIRFPHDESLAGRGERRSPLYHALLQRGCFYQSRHGFERPGWFAPEVGTSTEPKPYDYYGAYDGDGAWRLAEGHPPVPAHKDHKYNDLVDTELTFGWPHNFNHVAEECRAARNGVAIFDQSYFGKFFLYGKDAAAAVQYLCGADMDKQVPGTVTYTPLCNERGGVEADLTVTRLPDDSGYYFAAGGNTATKDAEWIRRVVEEQGFDVTFEDRSDELTMISVQGPYSRELLAPLLDPPYSLSNEEQPFSTCRNVTLAGEPLMCLRLTFVGELGYELHVPYRSALHVYNTIRQAGEHLAATQGVPVRDAGYRAIDSLSAEKGYRHWHADLSNAETPLEANIGFTVLPKLKRQDVPNFIGRDALQSQRASGLRRKLVCLTLSPDCDIPLHGVETIHRDGECVGYVRSTAFGYTIGQTIAYGYVDCPDELPKITNKWLKAGKWQIGDRGHQLDATLHISSPFDPKSKRVQGEYEFKEAPPVPTFAT